MLVASPPLRGTLLGLAAAALAAQVACVGERCPPGTVYRDNACLAAAGDARPAAADQGPASDGRGDGSTHDGALSDRFGQSCTKHPQCAGKADFCMAMQGQPNGYCTYQGCDVAKNNCPDGYRCLDLSAYLITLPTACVKL